MIHYIKDQDSIVTFLIDNPDHPVNLLNEEFINVLSENLKKFCQDDDAKGIILVGAREDFCSGADLNYLSADLTPEAVLAITKTLHRALRTLETNTGKPVVAAINGNCLGGGLELALAAHHRIGLANRKIKVGFPEVNLGLLPGAGGTQRLPRLLPLQKALELLLEGKHVSPKEALALGLFQELADSREELLQMARTWILDFPHVKQPWDQEHFKLPGGGVHTPNGHKILSASTSIIQQKGNRNYPAPLAILNCVYEGLQLPLEKALEIESQYFTRLHQSVESKNMIRSLFFGLQACQNNLPDPVEQGKNYEVKKVGVLGAGMMGQGIALVAAKAGIDVVLKDVSKKALDGAIAYVDKVLSREVAQGKILPERREETLKRIHTSTSTDSLKGSDLIIEAVIEDRNIKNQVIKETEPLLRDDVVVGSNTSTLPISGLAQASSRSTNFIGIHFFSPVDKMPLVEIISGKDTGPHARLMAYHFTRKIQKTPIFVNDGRGFYTSRVFMTYIGEGMSMLNEGIPPALIENGGKLAGMPVGPLCVADEVGLDLVYHIIKQTEQDLGRDKEFVPMAISKIIQLFVEKLKRTGRKVGHGFYEYPADPAEKKFIWPLLEEYFPPKKGVRPLPSLELVKRRLLSIQSLETVRCMEEGIVKNARDADVGSILGWGYPAYTGGTLSYIEMVGLEKFIHDCQDLQKEFGDRFRVPALLRDMAKDGKSFYDN